MLCFTAKQDHSCTFYVQITFKAIPFQFDVNLSNYFEFYGSLRKQQSIAPMQVIQVEKLWHLKENPTDLFWTIHSQKKMLKLMCTFHTYNVLRFWYFLHRDWKFLSIILFLFLTNRLHQKSSGKINGPRIQWSLIL